MKTSLEMIEGRMRGKAIKAENSVYISSEFRLTEGSKRSWPLREGFSGLGG